MINLPQSICYFYDSAKGLHNGLPKGDMVPNENTAAIKTKMDKYTKNLPNRGEFENIPYPGFFIARSDRASYSGETHWIVVDPRGFYTTIPSKNLEAILDTATITEGIIQGCCVWARDNSSSSLFLLNDRSAAFTEAIQNTEILENKTDLKLVDIGDTVLIQSGITGIYMGVHSIYHPMADATSKTSSACLILSSKARRQIIKVGIGQYFYQNDVKVLKVISKASRPMTKEDAAEQINQEIECLKTYFSPYPSFGNSTYPIQSATGPLTYYYYKNVVRKVFPFSTTIEWIDTESITRDEAEILFDKSRLIGESGALILEDALGKKYVVDFPQSLYQSNTANCSINAFSITEIQSIQKNQLVLTSRRSGGNFVSSKKKLYDLSFFTKFYKINKHVKDNIYV